MALADIDTGEVQSAAETLRRTGHEAIALPLDVRDEAASLPPSPALARWGWVDVMDNNAAHTMRHRRRVSWR